MARNFYVILGVPSNASPEDIHDAYRRLVKASHPDVSGLDSGERFREVQEAWETLGDAEKRMAYDADLERAQRQPSRRARSSRRAWQPSGHPSRTALFDLQEFFTEPGGTYVSTGDCQEIHFGLQMTAAEAVSGGELPLRVPVQVRCSACAGAGSDFLFVCPACRGNGYQSYWRTVRVEVPGGLTNNNTLEVPLGQLGLERARVILHVAIDPF
jgi:molecular chaperone DnaJ